MTKNMKICIREDKNEKKDSKYDFMLNISSVSE